MLDLYRCVLSDVDPFSAECIYLTDDEIRDSLQWDKLDVAVADDIKQQFFDLCKEFRDIFPSAGNSCKPDTAQHSIDTGNAAPIKSRPYRLSPENRAFVQDAIAKMLEKGVVELSKPIILVENKMANTVSARTIES